MIGKDRRIDNFDHRAAPRNCSACPAGAATTAAQADGKSPSSSGFRRDGGG